jgi:hypothetical protein
MQLTDQIMLNIDILLHKINTLLGEITYFYFLI